MTTEPDRNQLARRINGLSKEALRVAIYSLNNEICDDVIGRGELWQDMKDKGMF